MRYRGRGVVMGASLSALVLIASGCAGAQEEEPTPSFASSTADAEPSPELTEPPYETELNLTREEKTAADDAYQVLVSFTSAYNTVATSGYENQGDALRYAGGSFREAYEDGFDEARSNGESATGTVVHQYHLLNDLTLDDNGGGEALFESCVDYSNFDLLDSEGKSLKADDLEPFIADYSLQRQNNKWLIVKAEQPGYECER